MKMLRLVFAAGLTALLVSCDNMQHQPAGSDTSRSLDARTAVPLPPAHAVARFAEAISGGQPERPPLDRALLARGQERHEIYCAPCHGADGYGQGIVVRRGFPAPPSYHDARVRGESDEQLYQVIADGTGRMLPMADRLGESDRWAVVAYVRALQLSQHAPVADLSAEDRRRLEESR
ncbi:MAG TPA: cytochrome c [Candidatus Didemnitutus sp.]|nr:cytochrome c [Candidatus Didemnitutus sp.]